MKNWIFSFLVSFVIEPIRAGTYIQAETDPQHKLITMNERGVPITGKNSLIFQIKACSDAYFVLSEKHRFDKPDERFFLVILGATTNANVNGIRDSCLGSCKKPSAKVVGQWLHCSTFRTFWLAWDGHGGLSMGSGTVALRNLLMKLRSPRPFLLNFLILWGQNNRVEWRFLLNNAPQFVFPRPYGGSTVEIPENTVTKKVILDLKATDQDNDMLLYSVVGEHSYTFKCAGSSLVLMNPVDYEEQSLYNVQLRVSDGSYASITHLTVIVTDVNDNAPEVDRIDPIEIPEQLPAGCVIGAITSARDVDTNDRITFSLKESDSSYFSVDPNTGLLYVRRTVDLDAMSVTSYIANMTLIVTDLVGHSTSTTVLVIVNDINGNPPAFSASTSTTLTSARPPLENNDVMKNEISTGRGQGRPQKVLPVVKHALTWMTGDNGRLPRVTMSRRVPPGSVVTILIASQSCSGTDGQVSYRILSVKDEKEHQVAGAYTVDAKTGQVTTTELFNKNVAVYNCLHVRAFDLDQPDRYIDGWVSVDVNALSDDLRDDLIGAESCKTRTELLLLQCMVGILSFCLLVSSCIIVCKRKSPIKVYPINLECRTCTPIQQTPPLGTTAGC